MEQQNQEQKEIMKLKNITLTAPFSIHYDGQCVARFFDVISAGVIMNFINANDFQYKL
jgi:hypothetical protein